MKKTIRVILLLFLFVLFAAGAAFLVRYLVFLRSDDPYKTFLVPRISASEFIIKDISRTQTELEIRTLLKNHLPFGLKADSLRYALLIGGEKVGQTSYAKPVSLKKNDSSWVVLPLTFFNAKLNRVLDSLDAAGKDSIDYRIEAVIYRKGKGRDFRIVRILPLFRLPEITITGLGLDSLNLSGARLQVHISFRNRNVFPVGLKDLDYRFAFGGNKWLSGHKAGVLEAPPRSTIELVLPLDVSFKEIGSTLPELIRRGKNITYKALIRFRTNMKSNMLRESRITIESEGKAKKLLELRKGSSGQ